MAQYAECDVNEEEESFARKIAIETRDSRASSRGKKVPRLLIEPRNPYARARACEIC